MKLIALIPTLFGLFLIVVSIYLMRREYIFAKKETILTHAYRVSTEGQNYAYQFQAGDQTFTVRVLPRSATPLPHTYPVRYLVENPKKHIVYTRPRTDTAAHKRFNWFKYILMLLIGILQLYCAVRIVLI